MKVLQIRSVSIRYVVGKKEVRAVEDVSFDVQERDVVGLVGESGSGKTTLAHGIMRLLPPNAYFKNGEILLLGKNIVKMKESEVRKYRWKDYSIVFQKSMNALSPVHRVGEQMKEALLIHQPNLSNEQMMKRIRDILELVRLPSRVIRLYPHELSGGMMQRVMIALALINNPKFVIFDEATTALDVVTQGQILDEIKKLVKDLSLTAMIITHDIGVVSEICNKVAVMYAGRLMEFGPLDKVVYEPLHPYTKALLKSHPDFLEPGEKMMGIPGNLPDLTLPMKGCAFAPRCPYAEKICFSETPKPVEVDGRVVACFKVKEVERA